MLLPFLQRRHLKDVWLKFINYPKEQQLLENTATIVAQGYKLQKRIYNFDIEASLDDIAQQTLNSLKEAHWDHPIVSTSAKQFSFWKYNNINDNQWSKIEKKQIIDVLRTILFDEFGFHLQSTRNPKLEDIFIDYVLENKIGWLCWKSKSVTMHPPIHSKCIVSDKPSVGCRPAIHQRGDERRGAPFIIFLHRTNISTGRATVRSNAKSGSTVFATTEGSQKPATTPELKPPNAAGSDRPTRGLADTGGEE